MKFFFNVALGMPAILFASFVTAQEGVASKTQFSIEREDSGDIAILINGDLFTRYVTSDQVANKPYFWPIIGPGGLHMTRAFPMQDVAGEKQDHPHHRSLWFGMHDIGGFDTWHEGLTYTQKGKANAAKLASLGQQANTKVVAAESSGNSAKLILQSDNVNPKGEVYLMQKRTIGFHVAENGSRVIDIEIALKGVKNEVVLLGKKDSGLSVRVAHSMCVDAEKGGRIINSRGDQDEQAWGKRDSWVDFNGPIAGKRMGVAILNHPTSFRYPTPWHTRTYGLFTANPFALKEVAGEKERGDYKLTKGATITLKHRIIFHEGDEKQADIVGAWKAFSKTSRDDAGKTEKTLEPDLKTISTGKNLDACPAVQPNGGKGS